MAVIVRVEPIDHGYDVVLVDDDELVLAHYDTGDCEICAGVRDHDRGDDRHARQEAERYAAQVRRLLHPTRSGR